MTAPIRAALLDFHSTPVDQGDPTGLARADVHLEAALRLVD